MHPIYHCMEKDVNSHTLIAIVFPLCCDVLKYVAYLCLIAVVVILISQLRSLA